MIKAQCGKTKKNRENNYSVQRQSVSFFFFFRDKKSQKSFAFTYVHETFFLSEEAQKKSWNQREKR